MLIEGYANDFVTTLDGAIGPSDTTFDVNDALPSGLLAPFRVRIEDEYLRVTDVSSLTWTVERGVEGSTAVSHGDATSVEQIVTVLGLTRTLHDRARGSRYGMSIVDDCWWGAAATTLQLNGAVMQNVNGTGAAISSGGSGADGNHPGRIQLSSGTTTTGRCCLAQGASPIQTGFGRLYFCAIFHITSFGGLSDGTNRYTIRSGFSDSAVGAATDGIQFRYVDNVNGGRWQAVTVSGGVETATDTGVSATAADDFHVFEIEVEADGSEARFYIDGNLVATNTTNIPTNGMRVAPLGIFKSLGTVARQLVIDYYACSMEFTTPR